MTIEFIALCMFVLWLGGRILDGIMVERHYKNKVVSQKPKTSNLVKNRNTVSTPNSYIGDPRG